MSVLRFGIVSFSVVVARNERGRTSTRSHVVEVVLVRGRMRSHEVVLVNEFLVSKETVVLRRWERSKQKQVRMAERSKALRSGRSLRM